MDTYPRFTEDSCVDSEAECMYRFVYGDKDAYDPHCHDFYELFITVHGTVTHLINGSTQKLPEGSLVFIRPNDMHTYIYDTPESGKTTYINFTFSKNTAKMLFEYLSEDFPVEYLLNCEMPPMVVLGKAEKERIIKAVSDLNLIKWQNKALLKLKMKACLAAIFVDFFAISDVKTQWTLPVWLSELLIDMKRPENFISGSERMIELSHKSREHLSRSMKKYCSTSISEYINDLRINYASNLLLHTNSPVLEICYDCGFQSPSYFYRAFKTRHGISPIEFRKRIIG